jgi:hypothetical protein
MGSLRDQIENVSELNKDVEALVTLQRERYLEVLQANDGSTKNPEKVAEFEGDKVIIRYPNPDAALPLPEKIN